MICKNCGKESTKDSQVCSRCGRQLADTPIDLSPVLAQEPKKEAGSVKESPMVIVCPKCRAKNPAHYLNCRLCGYRLQPKPKKKKSGKEIAIIVASVALLLAIVTCVVVFHVVPKNKWQTLIEKETYGDGTDPFLSVLSQYVELEVTDFSGKSIEVEVTSADVSKDFIGGYGLASDDAIRDQLASAKKQTKAFELKLDETGKPYYTYDYYNAAYCGLLDAYYELFDSVTQEMVKS